MSINKKNKTRRLRGGHPRILPRFMAIFISSAIALSLVGGFLLIRDLDGRRAQLLDEMSLGLKIRKTAVTVDMNQLAEQVLNLAAREEMRSMLSGGDARDLILGEEGWGVAACLTELEGLVGANKRFQEIFLLDGRGNERLRLDPSTGGPVLAIADSLPGIHDERIDFVQDLAEGELRIWLDRSQLICACSVYSHGGASLGALFFSTHAPTLLQPTLESGYGLPGSVVLVDGRGRLLAQAGNESDTFTSSDDHAPEQDVESAASRQGDIRAWLARLDGTPRGAEPHFVENEFGLVCHDRVVSALAAESAEADPADQSSQTDPAAQDVEDTVPAPATAMSTAISDWKIAAWVPKADSRALLASAFGEIRNAYFFALGALALLSWLLAAPAARKRRAELAERDTRLHLEQVLDSASDIIWTTEIIKGDLSRSRITSLNQTGATFFGLECFDDEDGPVIGDLILPDDVLRYSSFMREVLQGNAGEDIEINVKAKDGRSVTLGISANVISAKGVPIALQTLARDISEQKLTKERIIEAGENLRLHSHSIQAIMAEGELPARLANLVDVITSSAGTPSAAIYLFGEERRSLELAAAGGHLAAQIKTKRASLPAEGDNLCAHALSRQGPLHLMCRDFGNCREGAGVEQGSVAHFALPLGSSGESQGVLLLFGSPETEWRRETLEIFGLIGLVLGGVIHKEELARQLSTQVAEPASPPDATPRAAAGGGEYLIDMGQEIRGSLQSTIDQAQRLLGTQLDQQQREIMLSLKSGADSTLKQVNAVLDMSRIDAGRLEIVTREFSIRDCLRESLNAVALQAGEKELTLKAEVEKSIPARVYGDSARLGQVFTKLLDNAVKFTKQGGIVTKIELTGQSEDSVQLHFSVQDTGIGIPEEMQQSIFDDITDAGGTAMHKQSGKGLGLILSAKLVNIMGGRIWVQSTPGKGSTFHFTASFNLHEGLPEAPPEPESRERQPVPREQQVQTTAPQDAAPAAIPVDELTLPEREQALQDVNVLTTPEMQLPPMRVLLAEDHEPSQKQIMELLRSRGVEATVVATGIKAIEAIATDDFDLVLMDVEMPELDGMAATRAIRDYEKAAGGHVPIIAMSAQVMKDQTERCLEAGMDSFIGKPVENKELYAAIVSLLGKSKKTDGVGESAEQTGEAQLETAEERRNTTDGARAVESGRDSGMDDLSIFDRAAAMDRVEGDLELLIELAGMFREDSPGLIQGIENAVASGDSEALQYNAHTLKGSVGNFSAQSSFDAAFQLEKMGRDSEMSEAPQAISKLKEEIGKLETVLQELG